MRVWRALILALVAQAWPLACGTERAPYAAGVTPPERSVGGEDAGLMLGDAGEVPSGPCGSQSIPVISEAPNLSFIIDHSGSMGEALAGNGLSKYENARIALARVLGAIGHRVNYGATIFPGLTEVTGCEAGDELMPVAPGDSPKYARAGEMGPRLEDLLGRLSIAGVSGGTPAAATLTKSLPTLRALEGKTYVILLTDGAPNCNERLSCQASACIPNIERVKAGALDCTGEVNCCAPTEQDPWANLSCVDEDASLQAVQALSEAGVDTFVVGMPGSEPYENLLDAMAEAGGTARPGSPKYYSVADTEALEQALKAIAASVAISCDIPLDYEPPERDFVNVYFDGKVVAYDAEAGWEWTPEGHVVIRGSACEQLSAGDVLEVQILAGCKTVVK